ncbi:hypothetical protein [Paracoccus mutanolyticus]|uniref:hypothetical protein n=1 Tax=Paracoccus mutanolyticus TaxID=1499308 RepID=UPI001672E8C0|nr:hypothetical protein [Paracoccus mutanolyticus]
MQQHFRERRKIDPGKIDLKRGDTLADGSPNNADRIAIGLGPTRLAFEEWDRAGLTRQP